MDMATYKDKALRTASPQFFGEKVNSEAFNKTLDELFKLNDTVDAVKKGLFYGKDNEKLLGKADEANKGAWTAIDADLVHAGLGLVTEGVEFLEKAVGPLRGAKKATKAELISELGDALWYANIATKPLDTDLGAVADGNIVKLAKRYPDAFSLDLANAKNVKEEDALIAETLGIGAKATEYGWLVEVKGKTSDEPLVSWFTATPGEPSFTTESTKALRFARREDAENFRKIFIPGVDAVVTEHAWD